MFHLETATPICQTFAILKRKEYSEAEMEGMVNVDPLHKKLQVEFFRKLKRKSYSQKSYRLTNSRITFFYKFTVKWCWVGENFEWIFEFIST